MTRQSRFTAACAPWGDAFEGPIQAGGHYLPVLQHGETLYVSGQVPRVGSTVVVTGRVGSDTSLDQARTGAQISILRALALLARHLGSLDDLAQVLRVTVYVQCSDDFTQHSEVADAASDLLFDILGDAGRHTRTSVGVRQLPKNASVEIDLIAACNPPPPRLEMPGG
ncbi:RidA family protein [Curvibacter sp. HBC28]|uniref:RidA family protein n=1 Tax=Curvibacter microcysteis TaxID=3026419 RepID=A0ABT5MEM4_9BURK|nr:RidA family protein [Curvibacter sp. HBC28]MDD0815030.1 RidA family protein [Curvibacter sp. HBC28]